MPALRRAERHRDARSLHLGLRAVPGLHGLAGVQALAAPEACRWLDWVLALAGAFAGAYLLLFYRELATRPGQPTTVATSWWPASACCCCWRPRAVPSAGRWPRWQSLILAYRDAGPYMPEVLSHKGVSL